MDKNKIKDQVILISCGILAVDTALSNVADLIVLLINKKLMIGQAVY